MQIEAKVEGFRSLKSDLDDKMAIVHENLDSIRTIVKENTLTLQNEDGVLTSDEAEYLKCIEVQHVKLEQLLRKDEAHWANIKKNASTKGKTMSDKLTALLEKQKKELAAVMAQSLGELEQVKPKYEFRKLPV